MAKKNYPDAIISVRVQLQSGVMITTIAGTGAILMSADAYGWDGQSK